MADWLPEIIFILILFDMRCFLRLLNKNSKSDLLKYIYEKP